VFRKISGAKADYAARVLWYMVPEMARRYFTVGEVDRLIPRLERIFIQVIQLRSAMRGEERKLERAGVTLSADALEKDTSRDPAAVRQAKMMFRAYYEALTEGLSEVDHVGGEVKDMEIGLVDFLARRGEEDILLCWKLGERSVEHWHPVDSGFRGRKPIDDGIPREPGLD
jgi:hypothetical protein